MRNIIIGLAAAGLLVTAAPAFAQIGVDVGPGGVGVGIGRDWDRDYRRDRVYEERRVYRDGDRYEGGGESHKRKFNSWSAAQRSWAVVS